MPTPQAYLAIYQTGELIKARKYAETQEIERLKNERMKRLAADKLAKQNKNVLGSSRDPRELC